MATLVKCNPMVEPGPLEGSPPGMAEAGTPGLTGPGSR